MLSEAKYPRMGALNKGILRAAQDDVIIYTKYSNKFSF
jgi:hypothetical protein